MGRESDGRVAWDVGKGGNKKGKEDKNIGLLEMRKE